MKYQLIQTEDQLKTFVKTFDWDRTIAYDTETMGLGWKDPLLGIIFANGKDLPAYIVNKTIAFDGAGIRVETLRKYLNPILEDIITVAHNAKYDLRVLYSHGFKMPILYADTMHAVHIYDSDAEKNLEKSLARDLNWSKQKFEDIIGKKWHRIDWLNDTKKGGIIPLETLAEYGAEDGAGTLALWEYYEPRLEKEELSKLLFEIEVPLCYTLSKMKCHGVKIDQDKMREIDTRLDKRLREVEREIYDAAGTVFNIRSPQQKAEVLFDKLGLPCLAYTEKGGRKTDKNVLSDLAALEEEGSEVAQLMVEHSSLGKLSSGYTKAIPLMVDSDGYLRADFNSAGTRTGRLSSSNPNLQNQPNNSEFNVRSAFVPSDGMIMFGADWSQIELRMMAHASKDAALIKAFKDGEDIHGRVAEDLGITRKGAKVINFGVLYGMGPDLLARTLGISIADADDIVKNYYVVYPGFANWKTMIEGKATRDGYVRTLFGRIRRLPNARSSNGKARYAALRQAVNTMIQGSSADLMKLALIRLDDAYTKRFGEDVALLLTVHDEVFSEAYPEVVEEAYNMKINIMENLVKLRVPIVAEGMICDNWGRGKEEDYVSLHERPEGIIKPTSLDLTMLGLM